MSVPHLSRRVRRELQERAEGHCEACCVSFARSKQKPVAHHLTNERRGHELVSDLLLVCPACHKECHDLEGSPPLPQYVIRARRAAERRAALRPAPPYLKSGELFGPAYERERDAGWSHEQATQRAAAYAKAMARKHYLKECTERGIRPRGVGRPG